MGRARPRWPVTGPHQRLQQIHQQRQLQCSEQKGIRKHHKCTESRHTRPQTGMFRCGQQLQDVQKECGMTLSYLMILPDALARDTLLGSPSQCLEEKMRRTMRERPILTPNVVFQTGKQQNEEGVDSLKEETRYRKWTGDAVEEVQGREADKLRGVEEGEEQGREADRQRGIEEGEERG
ncbi:hypothetical protein NDU88_005196 [Pleurodeles waltl]|uniref:Uncharacterized protein n=1 Tax=Pleurodeles waltl TaxID=8319 RepID=A0AAV7WWX1_PLEWA|nr:hypothetical protein NDU88_005196 [Pleurodeles waltl]